MFANRSTTSTAPKRPTRFDGLHRGVISAFDEVLVLLLDIAYRICLVQVPVEAVFPPIIDEHTNT